MDAVQFDPSKARESLVPLLPYQRAAIENPARFTWNCWSRQSGKSFTFSLRRVIRGLIRRRDQIILSAGERQSREVMEKVHRHCHAINVACSLQSGRSVAPEPSVVRGLEARLPGGVRIIALPANPLTARGFTGDVFLDEFAMHRDDDAIWAALFPSLLRGNGELDVASTPRGQGNLFHRLMSNPRFDRSVVTLLQAVDQGLDVDAAAMRAAVDDEAIWRQEFCCEFLDERTSFMPYALIQSCQSEELSTWINWAALQSDDAEVFVGVDVGRVRDLTAVWLWRRIGRVLETAGVWVMRAAPFTEQESALCALLSQRSVHRCCIDATGLGRHLSERLAERYGGHRVEGVMFTPAAKNLLAGGLRVAAERGLLRIPADAEVTSDWHSIERSMAAAGSVRISAERSSGGHGDRFWAAALGLRAAEGSMPPGAGFLSGGSTRFGRSGVW
ncbi:MAG: terminase family protein [Phycisphaerae bacterium]|nr:terminase family protein [Phycisphaerae bacterium]